jgi:putative FmdB family regulatory protein
MLDAMPLYDYKCRGCGRRFEELVKLGETPNCPGCGGNDLERLFAMPAVSTTKTRKRSLGKARRAARAVQKEKAHAQAEYERNYIKDHS